MTTWLPEEGGGGDAVESVNGETGVVVVPLGLIRDGDGTFAQTGEGSNAGGYATAGTTMSADAPGSTVHGYLGAGGSMSMGVYTRGGMLQGYAEGYPAKSAVAAIQMPGNNQGSFAGGRAVAFGGSATIEVNNGAGALAFGSAYGTYSSSGRTGSGLISAQGRGAVAMGDANAGYNNNGGSRIIATGHGSFARGFAYGDTSAGDAIIQAVGPGSVASGQVTDRGLISATADGAHAFGSASGAGSTITASGAGSFAQGNADADADIVASAAGAVQFAPGTNDLANSLAVGDKIRLNSAGAPGTPRNGDIWVANGYLYIRSNGVSVKIT